MNDLMWLGGIESCCKDGKAGLAKSFFLLGSAIALSMPEN